MRARNFQERRYVNVILTPHDRNRLRELIGPRSRATTPWVRNLILRELDREEAKAERAAPTGV